MNTFKPDPFKRQIRRITLDLVLIPFAFYLALLIRFDGHLRAEQWATLGRYVLPIALVYIAVHLAFGTYKRLWIHTNLRDIILLSETIGLGTLVLVVLNMYVFPRFDHHPLPTGCLVTGGLLTLVLSTIVKYRRQFLTMFFASWPQLGDTSLERVLIVGINETAQQLATRIVLGQGKVKYELAGFVDDDPDGQGMNINGAKILGTSEQIPTLVHDHKIDVIIIARRPSNPEEMWQLISACQKTAAQVKVVPDMDEVMEGRYEDPLILRDVNVEDLLGRAPVTVDVESCRGILTDKVVLVTGAAGSIGSELCRQILSFEPQMLVALDNNETGLYELKLELRQHARSPLQLIVADVSDWQKMRRVFQRYCPQVVFHAAAYKHVPMLEDCPDEALRVNVMGTVAISEVAHQYGAEHFVFISTDKAVNPSSVMGASKRVGELWINSLSAHSDTTFASVRFGNVVGSRGSVLPTFARQIEQGGPVTVTHPEMTRFFMSIPEAVRLVLQAATFSRAGDIFMLEMGDEVSILDLAQRMIRLKGLRVHKDIEIAFTGIRPGEKLHEELAYRQEAREETPHPSIYRLESPNGSMDRETLLGLISILMHCLRLAGGEQQVLKGIFQIASRDADGFLNSIAGLDLMRSWHQLPEGAAAERTTGEVIEKLPRKRRIADGILLAPGT
jgi:FlaA1/EpsC-like NDP-sugar epimerase